MQMFELTTFLETTVDMEKLTLIFTYKEETGLKLKNILDDGGNVEIIK